MTSQSSAEQSTSDFSDKAAESADAAIQSARQKANDAMDGFSSTMQAVKDKTTETLERLRPQLDQVANYAKEEPTKALLIAAAAGAGIMALVALTARSGGTSTPSAKSLRKAAEEASEEWRKAASNKSNGWRKAAQEATDEASHRADSLVSSAKGAAKSAYEGLSDTVLQWKDQAGPMVDRFRPQLDAVTTYAKDDPAKALLIAAAAGAALMGLMNSMSR